MNRIAFSVPLETICCMLKAQVRIFLATFSFSLLAAAAPVGICLYADSQTTPPERIQCFEFEKLEAAPAETRFFLPAGGSTVITAFRNRGVVLYPSARTTSPAARDALLKTYETHARQSPATRQYLNPWILKIRNNQAEASKQTEETAKLPSITLADGTVLKGCKALKKEGTLVSVRHSDGIRKIEISELSDITKKALDLDSIPTIASTTPIVGKGEVTKRTKVVSVDYLGSQMQLIVDDDEADKQPSENQPSTSINAAEQETSTSRLSLDVEVALKRFNEANDPEYGKKNPFGGSVNFGKFSGGVSDGKRVWLQEHLEAFKWYRKSADQGDALAQYFLGCFYAKGIGVNKDQAEAGKWFLMAANQGDAKAQAMIGYCSTDDVIAYMWCSLAVSSGDTDSTSRRDVLAKRMTNEQIAKAQQMIDGWKPIKAGLQPSPQSPKVEPTDAIVGGELAQAGEAPRSVENVPDVGQPKALPLDATENVKQLRIAADQGDAKSQLDLGFCYAKGDGVATDDTEATKWWRKAADQGDPDAQVLLGVCYDNGKGTPRNSVKAAEWYRKAAVQGKTYAQVNLGILYSSGDKVPQDHAEAVKWYRLAAEQGDPRGQYFLGCCYANGDGVVKNNTEAVKWLRNAADQGNSDAQFCLGACYAKGNGVVMDDSEAAKWWRKAADQGNAEAQFQLGFCYAAGNGVIKDESEALEWYRKSADQGHVPAQVNLGNCYYKGEGIQKNDMLAYVWYGIAGASGNASGKKNQKVSAKQMTRQQIAQADQMISDWKPKVAVLPQDTLPVAAKKVATTEPPKIPGPISIKWSVGIAVSLLMLIVAVLVTYRNKRRIAAIATIPQNSSTNSQCIKFECSHCYGHLAAEEELSGAEFACPHCGMQVTVPEPEEPKLSPVIFSAATNTAQIVAWGKRGLIRHRFRLIGAVGILVVLCLIAAGLSKRRPSEESEYIAQLVMTRESVQRALSCWEAFDMARQFPYGPHFRNMQADPALAEIARLQRDMENFGPAMRELCKQLYTLGGSGKRLIERRPDLKEMHEAIRLPDSLSLTIGDPMVKNCLSGLKNDMEIMLRKLDVEYSKVAIK